MEKKVLQDIVAPETKDPKDGPMRKWDYGDGGLGVVRKTRLEDADDGELSEDVEDGGIKNSSVEDYTSPYHNTYDQTKKKGPYNVPVVAWIAGGLGLVVLFVVVGWNFFATATVKVILTQQTTIVDSSFSAVRVGGTGDVEYQVVKLQESETQEVKPTGEKEVQQKASGKIVVYSDDEKSLKLIANTRFQSPDGKIYRIEKPITIPPAKKDANSNLIKGSAEITVFADQPGESYNIGIVAFTIPGLVGTDLEKKYSAQGLTEMAGGYSGVLKFASDEDIQNASKAMQDKVREKLSNKVATAIEEDLVLYPDAIFIDFKTNVPTTLSGNGMLMVEETGLLRAFVFNRSELSAIIAKKSLSAYDNSPVTVRNLDELSFSFQEKETFDIELAETFNFTLKGDPHIVWEVDTTFLKNDLAGLRKGDISTIAKDYSSSVRRIDANIKPFWKTSFPNNPDAITIEEVLE